MQSPICVKSCDITLPCQSTCFFGFCRCVCRFHILQLVNTHTCTLSIMGSQSLIGVYDSGVKVCSTPQLKGEPSGKKYQFSHNGALHFAFLILQENLKEEIKVLEGRVSAIQEILGDLKVQLYAKFGNNINLEADEN